MGHSKSSIELSRAVSGETDVLRHELANALSGFLGPALLLRSTRLSVQQKQWLEAMEVAAQQMAFLLRDGVAAAGSAMPAIQRVNGQRLLENAVVAHAHLASQRGLRLHLCIEPDLSEVWRCDPGLLRQLLDNLLGNAVKFTASGDVILSAKRSDGRTLQLSVKDTGPGIEAAERERIFEVRERGQGSDACPGMGIGLAVCRTVADRMGGQIQCHSDAGAGSEFLVLLPGVLERECLPRKPRAFREICCELALDDPQARCIEAALQRLGVGRVVRCAGGSAEMDEWRVLIRSASGEGPVSQPGLLLESLGPTVGGTVSLGPPVFQSALERALLTLALEFRRRSVSRGDIPY